MVIVILLSWKINGNWVVRTLSRRRFSGLFLSHVMWVPVFSVRSLFMLHDKVRHTYVPSATTWQLVERGIVYTFIAQLLVEALVFMIRSIRRFWTGHQN